MDKHQEGHEISVIADTNTVIDPWAVVVESFNASVAHTAVSRPVGPYYLTVRTEQNWIKVFKHREKVYLGLLDITGV